VDFITALDKASIIFIRGKGRSLLVGKGLAMRLGHLGLRTAIVGSVTTPPITKDDLLIVISGSGSIKSNGRILDVANDVGANSVAFTANKDSYIAKNSKLNVIIPTGDKSSDDGYNYESRQLKGDSCNNLPLGTAFELACQVLCDSIIAYLLRITDESEETMAMRHTNVE
jgi:6-phospho-3-hexuloisomerase